MTSEEATTVAIARLIGSVAEPDTDEKQLELIKKKLQLLREIAEDQQ